MNDNTDLKALVFIKDKLEQALAIMMREGMTPDVSVVAHNTQSSIAILRSKITAGMIATTEKDKKCA